MASNASQLAFTFFHNAQLKSNNGTKAYNNPIFDYRKAFWSAYYEKINFYCIVSRGNAEYLFGNDHYYQEQKRSIATLKGGSSTQHAFIMQMGKYTFVEFSTAGSWYVYDNAVLPFRLGESAYHMSELRNQRLAKHHVIHNYSENYYWQKNSASWIRSKLGIEPLRSYRLLIDQIKDFNAFGKDTIVTSTEATTGHVLQGSNSGCERVRIETYINEFWTAKQRKANALHEISYRACFKPQLPRFFIERLTLPGDAVYDPFAGRGTTLIESALLGRVPLGCDINPLSAILTLSRLNPPTINQVADRLSRIELEDVDEYPEELLVFYHPETLKQICALKKYLRKKEKNGELDRVDEWLRVVALSRLTGHSSGFFSVYTLPPNQAVSIDSQKKINEKRNQEPPVRDVKNIILKKTRTLLKNCDDQIQKILRYASNQARFLTQPSDNIPEIASNSIALVVTSPPFLDVVNYAQDNWLRCWFCGIDPAAVPITMAKKVEQWQSEMTKIFRELARVLKPGGHIAFEVGEVRHGKIKLEEAVIPCGIEAGLTPVLVLINDQKFTKTANVWGVDNLKKGTNTNRVVVFKKE